VDQAEDLVFGERVGGERRHVVRFLQDRLD
jgi:hypothetical protein